MPNNSSAMVPVRIGLFLFVILASSAAIGCGPSVGDVSGTVTYKGTALKNGSVVIYANNGETVGGTIEADGKFTIKNCPTGEGKVTVSSTDEEAGKKMAAAIIKGRDSKDPKGASGGKPNLPMPKSWIPEKYNDKETSGLTITVTSPSTAYDIPLK